MVDRIDCRPAAILISRINISLTLEPPGWILAIEDDLRVLTDEDEVVLMVKQNGECRRAVTQQLQAMVALIAL
ncbi:MAG: hypothetical protein RL042_2259 [Nitrospirota bacterium]